MKIFDMFVSSLHDVGSHNISFYGKNRRIFHYVDHHHWKTQAG